MIATMDLYFLSTGEAFQRRQGLPRVHPEAGVCDREAAAQLPREAAQLAAVAQDQLLHRARPDSPGVVGLAVPVHPLQSSVLAPGDHLSSFCSIRVYLACFASSCMAKHF